MIFRFRYHLTLLSFIFVFCWLFLPFFRKSDQSYSIHDFDEDMNKLYSSIGSSSQMRGDFVRAVRFYEDALKHRPDDSECLRNLNFCLKKIKKSFKRLT